MWVETETTVSTLNSAMISQELLQNNLKNSMVETLKFKGFLLELITITLCPFSENYALLLGNTALGRDLLSKLRGQIQFSSGETTLEIQDLLDTETLCVF